MDDPARLTATRDGDTIRLRKNLWSGSFQATDLPQWLAFYCRLRDRANGRYAKHYAADLEALELLL